MICRYFPPSVESSSSSSPLSSLSSSSLLLPSFSGRISSSMKSSRLSADFTAPMPKSSGVVRSDLGSQIVVVPSNHRHQQPSTSPSTSDLQGHKINGCNNFGIGTSIRLMDVKQGHNKEGKTVLYLVFEYMDTDLKKFIRPFRQSGENIPTSIAKCLMYQLCKGVAFCHGHGVLHRDLKPHNILMDRKTNMLQIADLGLVLTLWYRAPEVLLGATHYSTVVDMWSLGCIFTELVNKKELFPRDSELQQLVHILRLLGTPNEKAWPGVSKLMNWHDYPQWTPQKLSSVVSNLDEQVQYLLLQMLQYEPAKSFSAKKAIEHPYFDDVNKSYL